jgi:para-nitrobenzyl esterase
MRSLLALLALPFSSSIAIPPPSNTPIVHVTGGVLAGKLAGNISVFEGIPFAAPPLGNLRWREPQPPTPWSGTRDATHPANPCVQSAIGIDAYLAPLAAAYQAPYPVKSFKSSEDCLYLNVFSPWPLAPKALPVMLWLHGGSNRVGTGSDESYD